MVTSEGGVAPLTVRWTMEAEDILGGSQLFQRRSWWMFRFVVVGFLVFGLFTWYVGWDPSIWLPALSVAAVMGLYLAFGVERGLRRQGRSLLGEDVVFWVDEAGTHQDLAGSHLWMEWWALTDVSDNATTIVIRRDRLPSSFIPKRAFPSPADADAFLGYVRAHLGSSPVAGSLSHQPAPPDRP
jgi:hypothetical protein